MEQLPLNFLEFLKWMVSGGAAIAASWMLERAVWYQCKTAEAKRWIFFGIVAVISIISHATFTYVPPAVLLQLAPWFALVASAFVNTFVGTAMHRVSKVTPQIVANQVTVVQSDSDCKTDGIGGIYIQEDDASLGMKG